MKHTAAELELFKEQDMHLYVEDIIRGGIIISTVTKRHAVANNPHIPETCNADKPHVSMYIYMLTCGYIYISTIVRR